MLHPAPYLTPGRPTLEFLQYALHESLAAYRNALGPFRLSNLAAIMKGLFYPLLVTFVQLLIGFKTAAGNELLAINQSISLRRILDLSVTSVLPIRRMLHHTIPDHIQIDVDQASEKMPACFDRSSMIPIFPECALAGFPATS